MKLFGGILVLIMGIIISMVAAWFSVTGMVALFNASAIGVMAMMVSLEAGKLVASGWLKVNWANPNVNFLHRAYLLSAIVVLCLITSVGIYGYLSAGHLEQAAPRADIAVQTQPLELQLQQKNAENERLNQRLNQIDQNIGVFLKADQGTKGLSASKSLNRERDQIQKKIDENNTAINGLNEKLGPLKMQSNAVEAKLGPVKYVAALFGWEDEESAVRLIIIILMLAFDPLAIVLLLSAMTTLREVGDERNPRGPPSGGRKDEDDEGSDDDVPDHGPEPEVEPPYDVVGFDAPKEEWPLRVEEPEGSKFTPESLQLTPAPSLRTYEGFYNWYNQQPQPPFMTAKPPSDGPTFTVLEMPTETADDIEVLEQFTSEPDERDELLDELSTAVKALENEKSLIENDLAAVSEENDELVSKNTELAAAQDQLIQRLGELYAEKDKIQDALTEALARWVSDTKTEETTKELDRESLIAILERHPGILNEIEDIVESDVVGEMSDREKLLDLLEKNPSVINDMAEIITATVTGRVGEREQGPAAPGWLDR